MMAYIILAHICIKMFDAAADRLRQQGHRVEITNDLGRILKIFKGTPPHILVLSSPLFVNEKIPEDEFPKDPAASWALQHGLGFAVIGELKRLYPNLTTRFLWITTPDDHTVEPIYNWDDEDISTFLRFPPTEWEVVLAVEQALYRNITTLQKSDSI